MNRQKRYVILQEQLFQKMSMISCQKKHQYWVLKGLKKVRSMINFVTTKMIIKMWEYSAQFGLRRLKQLIVTVLSVFYETQVNLTKK